MSAEKTKLLETVRNFTRECQNMEHLYVNTQKKFLKVCIYIHILIKMYELISDNDIYIANIVHFVLAKNKNPYFNLTGALKLDKLLKLKQKYMIEIKKLREKITGIKTGNNLEHVIKDITGSNLTSITEKTENNDKYIGDNIKFVIYMSGPNYCKKFLPDNLEGIQRYSIIYNFCTTNLKIVDKFNEKCKDHVIKSDDIWIGLIVQGEDNKKIDVKNKKISDVLRINNENQIIKLLPDIDFITLEVIIKMNLEELCDYIYQFSESVQDIQKNIYRVKLVCFPSNPECRLFYIIKYHLDNTDITLDMINTQLKNKYKLNISYKEHSILHRIIFYHSDYLIQFINAMNENDLVKELFGKGLNIQKVIKYIQEGIDINDFKEENKKYNILKNMTQYLLNDTWYNPSLLDEMGQIIDKFQNN